MNYDVDYFIKKFEAIPEEKWNSFTQYDSGNDTRCAFGHCASRVKYGSGDGAVTPEGVALQKLFSSAGYYAGSGNWITDVNNGRSEMYPQPTPKQRILAALYDIKKLQTTDTDTMKKERIVYVSVPVSITEQSKDLVLS